MSKFDTKAIADEFGVDQYGMSIVSAEEIEAALNGSAAVDEALDMIDGLRFHNYDFVADEVAEEYADYLAEVER